MSKKTKITIKRNKNKSKREEATMILEEITISKLVVEVDERIHKACKIEAAKEGTTLRQIVEDTLIEYLENRGVDFSEY